MNTEPLIRISIFFNRKKDWTEEEFHRYWAHTHGPLVTDWLLRCGIVRYVQYHTPSEQRKLAQKMSDAVGRPVMNYDAAGDFWVRDYKDFEAAFLDQEYQEKIRPDELKFIDMDSIQLTVGMDFVVIDDGKALEEHQRSF